MKILKHIIDKIFRKEDILRGDGNVYLRRWTLLRFNKTFWLWRFLKVADTRIYIHLFLNGDHTACLHDHPNDLISFIFWNGYEEEYWNPKTKKHEKVIYKAPCLRRFPASHTHRVQLLNNNPAWSIVVMKKKVRDWGFWITNTTNKKRKWIKWDKYYNDFGGNRGCE